MAGTLRRVALRGMGAAALLACALGPAAGALAADPQAGAPEQAVRLDRPLSGHLEGGAGGHFAYYTFAYPADGSTVTVNLQVRPDDPAVLANVGFHVYAPDGKLEVSGGDQTGLVPDVSGDVSSADPAEKGEHVVQVYDYDPGAAIDYTLSIAGLPAAAAPVAPAPPAAPQAAAAPAPVGAPSPVGAPAAVGAGAPALGGHLGAGAAGHFARFAFSYPGDESVYTLNLQASPDDGALLAAAGFEVYGPDGALVVRGGAEPGMTPNVSANVISKVPGTYLVQVYNYHPAIPLDYQLSL
ncbi:MAG TPA: hypothetical protein VGM69_08785, partial [Chloroflexota bacterium]